MPSPLTQLLLDVVTRVGRFKEGWVSSRLQKLLLISKTGKQEVGRDWNSIDFNFQNWKEPVRFLSTTFHILDIFKWIKHHKTVTLFSEKPQVLNFWRAFFLWSRGIMIYEKDVNSKDKKMPLKKTSLLWRFIPQKILRFQIENAHKPITEKSWGKELFSFYEIYNCTE